VSHRRKSKESESRPEDDGDDHNLALARALLNEQRQLAASLAKRLEVAVSAIERQGNTPRKTWRERLQMAILALRRPTTWIQFFVAASVMIGFVSSLYSLGPRISLSWGDPLDADNGLSGFATISNDGALPVYDVWVNCAFGNINDRSGGGMSMPGTGMVRQESNHAGRIGPGQKFTALDVCTTPVTQNPTTFDFTVRVTFKPFLLPEDYRDFRIVSVKRHKDGRVFAVQRER
jgi:hypothetical protein